MKPNKIINGFCYLVDDTIIFISLYTERKYHYEAELFKKFIKEYKITKEHIILAHEENGGVTPLYRTAHKGKADIDDTDFDELIEEVYSICIDVTKGMYN